MENVTKTPTTEKEAYLRGIRAGVFGLVSNALLFAAKLATGLLIHSIAVVADAFNNLSDGASGAVTIAGYKLASRPADREHPFGHARFEYIAALTVTIVMFMIGAIFLKESIEGILAGPSAPEIGVYAYVVLGVSILVKGAQAVIYGLSYKRTRSLPMKAAATDSLGDMIVTSGALLSAVLWQTTGVDLDGWFGAAISLFILFTAVRLMKEGVSPLLGAAPSEELVGAIKGKVASFRGVLGVHDVVIHSYGAARVYAVIDVEIAADTPLTEAHALADRIEREVSRDLGVRLVVHVDPRTTEKAASERAAWVRARLAERFEGVSTHDLSVVEEDGRVRVYFDAEIPYESDLTAEEIVSALTAADPTCEYVVGVDRK